MLLTFALLTPALAAVTPREATTTLAKRIGAVVAPSENCRQIERSLVPTTYPADPTSSLKFIEGQRYRLDTDASLSRSLVDIHLITLGFELYEPWEQLPDNLGFQAFILTPETPNYAYFVTLINVPGSGDFGLGHTDACLVILGIRR